MEKISSSVEETLTFAKSFAEKIQRGDIIVLEGDLGAGKTHFVKGFASGIGSKSLVTSPTFTIMNIYEGGRMPVYHFDMYRLSSKEEAEELGFEEYFDASILDGVSIVEWPSQVEGLIKPPYYKIQIEKLSENARKIFIGRVEK